MKICLQEFMITNEDETPEKESAILAMRFQLKRHHAPKGRMKVRSVKAIAKQSCIFKKKFACRCEASILNAYHGEKELEIFVETHTAAANKHNNSGSGGVAPRFPIAFNIMVIFLVVVQLYLDSVNLL